MAAKSLSSVTGRMDPRTRTKAKKNAKNYYRRKSSGGGGG